MGIAVGGLLVASPDKRYRTRLESKDEKGHPPERSERPDQFEQPLIGQPLRNPVHQDAVVDPVAEIDLSTRLDLAAWWWVNAADPRDWGGSCPRRAPAR